MAKDRLGAREETTGMEGWVEAPPPVPRIVLF